jgi:hypothetical protein
MSQDLDRNPPNYPVTNPDGSVSPRYPVETTRRELVPASSAHAYIDYLEGCLAEIRLRLEPLEHGHADLVAAFFRRCAEFESRLDNHGQRLHAIEHPIVTKNS